MEKYFETDHTKIRFRELNPGASEKPLLMINGTGLNYECWKPLSKNIAQHMVVFDLPGFGRSSLYKSPPTMSRYVDDTVALMDHLHYDKFDIAGYSFGGVLAQAITETYPEIVNKLVLLSTTPGFSGQIPSYKAVMMGMTFGRAIAGNLLGFGSKDGDIIRNLRPGHGLGPVYSTAALASWSKLERKVNDSHEAMIVHGSKDTLLPFRNAVMLKEYFPDAHLDIISGADHLAPLVHGEYVAANINGFLS